MSSLMAPQPIFTLSGTLTSQKHMPTDIRLPMRKAGPLPSRQPLRQANTRTRRQGGSVA